MSLVINGKETGGGGLFKVWFLKRKPSLVGMVISSFSKEIPSLMQATNSEHLFPEAMATRKMVFKKRSSREAEQFQNLGVWRDSNALFRDHLGTFLGTGGERWS